MSSDFSRFQNKIKINPLPKRDGQAANPQTKTKPPVPFRPRAGLPKVRSGCATCKKRRVKCDEEKPDCRRCTSTGRTCEGYILHTSQNATTDVSLGSSQSPPSPGCSPSKEIESYSSLFDNDGDNQQLRSFEYILSHIDGISGYFVSNFWVRLVLQVSHSEPTVRYALLALSSLYECHEHKLQGLESSTDHLSKSLHQRALSRYTQAVTTLSKKMSEGPSSLGITLMTCLLFIWLEFLRNDFQTGFRHLKSGLKILQAARADEDALGEIELSIEPLFERLKGQIAFMGCPDNECHSSALSEYLVPLEPIPSSFFSVSEACSYLDKQLSSIFVTIRRQQEIDMFWGENRYPKPAPFPLEDLRLEHLQRLREWDCAFQSLKLSSHSQSPETLANIYFAQVNHYSIFLVLETLFPESQMVYDAYTSQFTHLISLIKTLMSISNLSNRSLGLSFEQGVIAPLVLIVAKCRVLDIRKQALELLRQAPVREGMLHRDSAYRWAALKVYVEERARVGDGLEGLPEYTRTTREMVTDLGGGRVRVTFRRTVDDGTEFTEDIEGFVSDYRAML